MAEVAEETKFCANCGEFIPAMSFMMHELHCARNIFKCACGEKIRIVEKDNHECPLDFFTCT